MRVTQSMLTANLLQNLRQSNALLDKYQEQLYTQRKISRPSDDPVIAMKGMAYRTNLTEVEQYTRNLSEMYNWMDHSEAGLEQANAILQRVNELIVRAANDTNDEDDRLKIKEEITQLKLAYRDVANTKVAGKYIFNGTNINTEPVALTNDTIISQVSDDPFLMEVSKDVRMRANIVPSNVFGQDVFEAFASLEVALEDSDNDALEGHMTAFFDNHLSSLLAERAELGARYNRIELIEDRLGDQEVLAYKILKENEGADMEKVITDLKMQETIHRAALSVGARIMQPSLLDFLR